MNEALAIVHRACLPRVPWTLEQVQATFAGWEVIPLHRRGAMVATVLIRGPEIHVACDPGQEGRWLSRRFIRDTVGRLIDEYGYAETMVSKANAAGHAFVQRLGFEKVSGGDPVRYVCKELKHV